MKSSVRRSALLVPAVLLGGCFGPFSLRPPEREPEPEFVRPHSFKCQSGTVVAAYHEDPNWSSAFFEVKNQTRGEVRAVVRWTKDNFTQILGVAAGATARTQTIYDPQPYNVEVNCNPWRSDGE